MVFISAQNENSRLLVLELVVGSLEQDKSRTKLRNVLSKLELLLSLNKQFSYNTYLVCIKSA